MNEKKIKALENKLHKPLKNRPYSVVWAECDRIGRQIVVDKSKSTSES